MEFWRRAVMHATCSLLMACGSGDATPPTATPVGAVVLTPSSATLAVGGTTALEVIVTGPAGDTLPPATVIWSSSNVAVARVSNAGLVTAVAPGTARIAATVRGQSATATVSVVPVSAASVSVVPTSATLLVGGTRQLQAEVRDASGALLTGRPVSWSTSTPAVTSVSATGVVTALAPGVGQVTATSGGRSGVATIVVEAAPLPVATVRVTVTPESAVVRYQGSTNRTVQLVARVSRQVGLLWVPVPDATVTWSSANPQIASVRSDGLVSGVSEGRTQITATSGNASATAVITVERR